MVNRSNLKSRRLNVDTDCSVRMRVRDILQKKKEKKEKRVSTMTKGLFSMREKESRERKKGRERTSGSPLKLEGNDNLYENPATCYISIYAPIRFAHDSFLLQLLTFFLFLHFLAGLGHLGVT